MQFPGYNSLYTALQLFVGLSPLDGKEVLVAVDPLMLNMCLSQMAQLLHLLHLPP